MTFDLLSLKVVSELRVTWATSMPILVFLDLSVLELGPMCATDRQTDVRQTDIRQKHRLMPPPYGGGGIIIWMQIVLIQHRHAHNITEWNRIVLKFQESRPEDAAEKIPEVHIFQHLSVRTAISICIFSIPRVLPCALSSSCILPVDKKLYLIIGNISPAVPGSALWPTDYRPADKLHIRRVWYM